MKRRNFLFSGVAACTLGVISLKPTTAMAGMVVYDPTNWAQNVLQAIRALQANINDITKIANQIQQITNQVTQITQGAKNLMNLPFTLQSAFQSQIMSLQNVLAATKGLVMDYSSLDATFNAIYNPAGAGYGAYTESNFQTERNLWIKQTIDAANDAMRAQGLVADLDNDRISLDNLLTASQTAPGALQASQAANQISGLMVTQLMRLQTIFTDSYRAQSSYVAGLAKEQQVAAYKRAQQLVPKTRTGASAIGRTRWEKHVGN
jgi:type IV secretion system protein TrbJ